MANQTAPRGRGRPKGATAQSAETKTHLYETAIRLFQEQGFETITLRRIAQEAGVSVGLLYRYFPSKRALVLELYERLSSEYARTVDFGRERSWKDRHLIAVRTSLQVLGPHRRTLHALLPLMVSTAETSVLGAESADTRELVRDTFIEAVTGARDAPGRRTARSLGRLLYLAHLAILLFWLLDKSPEQRATDELMATLDRSRKWMKLALSLPLTRSLLRTADRLVEEALISDPPQEVSHVSA